MHSARAAEQMAAQPHKLSGAAGGSKQRIRRRSDEPRTLAPVSAYSGGIIPIRTPSLRSHPPLSP